jgi:hypothetical protein
MEIDTEALQVSMQSADIERMEHSYQRMHTEERERHHDELRDEGYEWCPECGTVLIWDLPAHRPEPRRSAPPVICGDFPPITAEDLALTGPSPS